MLGRDLYIKRNNKDGSHVITHHRVWDADRFLASQQAEAKKESAKDPAKAYTIVLSTEKAYKEQ